MAVAMSGIVPLWRISAAAPDFAHGKLCYHLRGTAGGNGHIFLQLPQGQLCQIVIVIAIVIATLIVRVIVVVIVIVTVTATVIVIVI